jgi:hypothetical protein
MTLQTGLAQYELRRLQLFVLGLLATTMKRVSINSVVLVITKLMQAVGVVLMLVTGPVQFKLRSLMPSSGYINLGVAFLAKMVQINLPLLLQQVGVILVMTLQTGSAQYDLRRPLQITPTCNAVWLNHGLRLPATRSG